MLTFLIFFLCIKSRFCQISRNKEKEWNVKRADIERKERSFCLWDMAKNNHRDGNTFSPVYPIDSLSSHRQNQNIRFLNFSHRVKRKGAISFLLNNKKTSVLLTSLSHFSRGIFLLTTNALKSSNSYIILKGCFDV